MTLPPYPAPTHVAGAAGPPAGQLVRDDRYRAFFTAQSIA